MGGKKILNILYVAHERKLGGATLSLLSLIDEMKAKGHEIYVIVPTGNCPLAKELRKRSIPFITVFFGWIQMPSYWNIVLKYCFRLLYFIEPLQVWYVYCMMKQKKIDIVHTNSSVTDFGARIAQKLSCKHIWHIREFGDADYSLEYLKEKKKTWEYMNAHTDKFIFISKNLYEYFKEYADEKKSLIIYNGISVDYFIERNYQPKEKVVFLISGNLLRSKGQILVLQAANKLKRENDKFEVWIAGSESSMGDSKRYTKELRTYIKQNLHGIATMLGRVIDMKSLREKADVEIIASQKEAFGRVTIEAMMGGMPVIASDSGANPELVEDKVDGLLYECDNYEDLVIKMKQFIVFPQMIAEMGRKAQKKAVQNYSLEKNKKRVESIYFQTMLERQ